LYFASGGANYRKTKPDGTLIEEERNRPFILLFGATVLAQSAVSPAYPCENWAGLGTIYMVGGAGAYLADDFNYWSGFVGRPPYPDWSPRVELEASFDV
jgi:hypothetical protein